MNCPKCLSQLEQQKYRGIEIEKCANCGGMWFDYDELDELEDQSFSADDLKGSLFHRVENTEMACPHCGTFLKTFQYRFHNLKLEYCENQHGFWLDAGEEKRTTEMMIQREKNMERKIQAEAEWGKYLKKLKKKSFWDKITDKLA